MQQKKEKTISDFQISAFEIVKVNTPFYWERIHFIRYQYVKNSLKTSDPTKTEFFELVSFQCEQEMWEKYCRADLSTLSVLLIS